MKSGLVGSSLNGIGMENLRELKFFTELGIADHPNFIKVELKRNYHIVIRLLL